MVNDITVIVVIAIHSCSLLEHALVLQKDSTAAKTFSRWIDPAVICG